MDVVGIEVVGDLVGLDGVSLDVFVDDVGGLEVEPSFCCFVFLNFLFGLLLVKFGLDVAILSLHLLICTLTQ